MIGAIIMVILLVVVIPVAVLMTGGVAAGVIGDLLRRDGERRHEGSELIELNN